MKILVIAILVAIPAVILGTGIWLEYIQPFVRRLGRKAKEAMASLIEPLLNWLDELDPQTLADFASAMPMFSGDPLYPTSSLMVRHTERPTSPSAQTPSSPLHIRPT